MAESGEKKWDVVNMPLGSFFEDASKSYQKDTEAGVEDRLHPLAYQMLGTYGVFEDGNRYGSDFGAKAEAGYETDLGQLKEELKTLI